MGKPVRLGTQGKQEMMQDGSTKLPTLYVGIFSYSVTLHVAGFRV